MAPGKPPTLYINQKPYFVGAPSIATNLPTPLAAIYKEDDTYTSPRRDKEERGQGVVLP
jgi:hypothetical protein